MKTERNGRTFIAVGDSLPDVMRWIERTPRIWDEHSSMTVKASYQWDLNTGWQGAMDLLKTGWREGGRSMRLVFDSLPRKSGAIMETVYSPVKGIFSMSRYVEGNPACFIREVEEEEEQAPIVRLAVNTTANAGTSADCLHNYGAAIAAGVEALELAGTRVEVTVYCVTNCGRDHRAAVGWLVKRAGEPLDMAAMAFSVAHPAAFRRIGFALLERSPADFQVGHGSYGAAGDILPGDLSAPAIIINASRSASSTCATPALAVATIQATINDQIGRE